VINRDSLIVLMIETRVEVMSGV